MSAKYTFLAWETPVKDASTKLALLQIANNSDDHGFSYYSISKMAKACDMSDRNFMRKIKILEEMKVLIVERRANRPSLYTLVGDEMGVTICHLQESEVTGCHAEVTDCHAEGDKLSHDPNSYPNTNPNSKDLLVQPEAKPSKFKFEPDDLETVKWMFSRVQILNPTAKKPNLENWANTIRLMREIDERELGDICNTFNWANKNSFWCMNILSPSKLRQQFDKLKVRINEERKQGNGTGGNGSKSNAVEANNKQLLEQYGHATPHGERTINSITDPCMDSHEVSRGIHSQMGVQGITLDMDARDLSHDGGADTQGGI